MRSRSMRVVLPAVLALLAVAGAEAGPLADDLAARRSRLMERLGPDTMLVLLSAPPRVYSNDIDYEYRQDSNLYYLTGITQENTALVLMPGNATHRELLFIKDRNPEREHWTGRLLAHDEARELTGIQTVLSIGDFDDFVGAMLGRRSYRGVVDPQDAARFFGALSDGRARLALAMNDAAPDDPPTPASAFLERVRSRYVGYVPVDATPSLNALRQVKTPYELELLTKAAAISVDAQRAGARAGAPGAYEYQVKAAIEAVHRANNATWSYPSIVASGPNATTLHYPDSSRQMQAGELLLVDAAAAYGYQAADVTRTYPVGGRFSPAQRDIYALVLKAHDEAVKAARPGATLSAVHGRAVEVLKDGLMKLGLITDTSGRQYAMWFTHGTSHFIGVDVHDVGSQQDVLQPGMTFTIEPGLYIRQSALDQLPRTDANLELIAKIKDAVARYSGIGVRIEDSFVMEDHGVRNLSAALPVAIDDVESLMRAHGPTAGRH